MILLLLRFFATHFLYPALHLEPGSFPRPLTAQEEADAFAALRRGEPGAQERLIRHNMRLVAHVAKKYYALPADRDDLISIGTIGLLKAVNTFDSARQARFSTYASRCIENEILMYFRSQRKLQSEISLSDTLDAAGEGGSLSLMDVLAVDDDMLENLDAKDACAQVRRCVKQCLTPRENLVVTLRYGLDGHPPRTQREVAARCGISRSYISRIEKRALEKLQNEMRAAGFSGE
jgi:RNA polymerase sporulation-specific sigma factor